MQQVSQEIISALEGVGFSDDEASVYQTCLSLGSRPASVIAQKAGFKRTHTYNILGGLRDKGVVQEHIKNGVRHFSCSPPESLVCKVERQVENLQHRKKKLESVLPILETLKNPNVKQPKVRYYQGKSGIYEIFEDILRTPGQDMYSVVDFRYSWSVVDDQTLAWIKNFIARREKLDICWRAIAVRSELCDKQLKERSSAKRVVKAIDGVDIGAEINIYGNKVALTSTYQEMIGVVIEDEPIAKTLLSLHHVLSATLPDYVVE